MLNFLTNILSAATASAEAAPEITFEPGNFVANLQYMGIGMLVIFVIIGVIILATVAINKIFSSKKEDNQ